MVLSIARLFRDCNNIANRGRCTTQKSSWLCYAGRNNAKTALIHWQSWPQYKFEKRKSAETLEPFHDLKEKLRWKNKCAQVTNNIPRRDKRYSKGERRRKMYDALQKDGTGKRRGTPVEYPIKHCMGWIRNVVKRKWRFKWLSTFYVTTQNWGPEEQLNHLV